MHNHTKPKDDLPDGWVWTKIESISELFRGISYKKDESSKIKKPGYKPILRANNINNGNLNFEDLVYVPQDKISDYQYIQTGDIIFAMSSGSKKLVGKSALAKEAFDGSYGAFCAMLRGTNLINNVFLGYFFQGSHYKSLISKIAKGTNINNLKREHILNLDFPLPPLPEQHRIVAKIDELFSDLDQSVTALTEAQAQLSIYRQAVLKDAFEGKLTAQWRAERAHHTPHPLQTAPDLLAQIKTERQARYQAHLTAWQAEVKAWEAAGKPTRKPSKPKKPKELPPLTEKELAELGALPEGWCWTKVGNLTLNVEYGSSAKSKKEGKVPVLRMGNIQNNRIDWSDLVYSNDDKEIQKYLLKKHDVLFNRTNSPELVGKTAIYLGERPAIFAGYLIRINQFRSLINAKYLNYFMNCLIAKNHSNKVKTDGVNQSNINGQKLMNYPLPYTSLVEQQAIVSEIESRLSIVDKLEETIKTALQQAQTLRQSILKRAFAGNL